VLDALSASETQRKKEPGKAFTDLEDIFYELMGSYDASWATRIGVHFGLFMGAIQSQGTEEQVERFLDESRAMRILGCFAMTELGHGSYVQGMETTATFDASRQEFVIHSPTITSTKFWIGLAGQTATHAVVFAQLVTQGRSLGVHPFVVQIRDVRTGLPMPGVSVGDCGSKMGRDGVDNGWVSDEDA
jgi:acyl-CoA oxidase